MRTFNGLQIFTEQLTNSGQLDLRYVRISGNNSTPNFNLNLRLSDYGKPTGEYSPGISGQIGLDSNSFYVCVSGNGVGNGKWKFIPLTNWNLAPIPV
jgi:hypothetical protein